MFCKNCGFELAEDKKFCPSCGTPVGVASEAVEEAPAQQVVAPQTAEVLVQQTTPAKAPAKKKLFIIIGAAAVVVIAAVVLLIVLLGKGDSKGGVAKVNVEKPEDAALAVARADFEKNGYEASKYTLFDVEEYVYYECKDYYDDYSFLGMTMEDSCAAVASQNGAEYDGGIDSPSKVIDACHKAEIDYLKEHYGDADGNYTLTVEIDDIENYDPDSYDFYDIIEDIEWEQEVYGEETYLKGIDVSKITEIVEVDGDVILDNGSDDWSNGFSYVVVKYDGNWRVFDYEW